MTIQLPKNNPILPLIILSLFLSMLASILVLKLQPFSGDEEAYLFQAEIFSHGLLYAPAPQSPESFALHYTSFSGEKWFSVTPIAWSLILAPFFLLKTPWILNPILAALTLVLFYLLSRSFFESKTAQISILFLVLSPFFILNSASLFPHTPSLFFSALPLFLLRKFPKNRKPIFPFLSGLSIGLVLLIRPIDGIIFSVPLTIYAVSLFRNSKQTGRILFFILPFAFLSILLLYTNLLYSGNPLLFPNLLYGDQNSFQHFSLSPHPDTLIYNFRLLLLWFPMFILIPFSFLKPKAHLAQRGDEKTLPIKILLLSILLLNIFVFLFIPLFGGDQFGPRHYYVSLLPLTLLSANGLRNLLQFRPGLKFLLPAILIANILLLSAYSLDISSEVHYRSQVYSFVSENNITNAIVLLKSSPEEGCSFYTRNSPFLENPVLYACDIGNNSRLFSLYPERQFYSYNLSDFGQSPSNYHKNLRYVSAT